MVIYMYVCIYKTYIIYYVLYIQYFQTVSKNQVFPPVLAAVLAAVQ